MPCLYESNKNMNKKSQNPLSRRNVVLGGAAAIAGSATVFARSKDSEAVEPNAVAQSSSSGILAGKVALVTGAARAIGRACAVSLASQGADVVVMDIANPDAFPYLNYPMASMADLAETKRLVEEQGTRCLSIQADVRNMEQMREMVARTINEFGKLDIASQRVVGVPPIVATDEDAIANAGLVPSVPLVEMTDQQWNDVIEVNLTGVGNTIRASLPHMVERKQGQIVAITSTLGRQGNAGNAHYVASKWGIVGLVKSAALEAGEHNVTVNAVAPTGVRTIRFPESGEQREAAEQFLSEYNALPVLLLEPSDIADSVVFLVSPQATSITGAVIDVAAGANAKYTA